MLGERLYLLALRVNLLAKLSDERPCLGERFIQHANLVALTGDDLVCRGE